MNFPIPIFGVEETDEERCDGHHYDEWEEHDEYKAKCRTLVWNEDGEYLGQLHGWGEGDEWEGEQIDAVLVKRRKTRKCLHDDCDKVDERWIEYSVFPILEKPDEGRDPKEFKKSFKP